MPILNPKYTHTHKIPHEGGFPRSFSASSEVLGVIVGFFLEGTQSSLVLMSSLLRCVVRAKVLDHCLSGTVHPAQLLQGQCAPGLEFGLV
jgi:hypothetical protein